jgi:hypothetical protein
VCILAASCGYGRRARVRACNQRIGKLNFLKKLEGSATLDFRIRQTVAAFPAKPGDLPVGQDIVKSAQRGRRSSRRVRQEGFAAIHVTV